MEIAQEISYQVGSHFIPALINDDESGLEDNEIELLNILFNPCLQNINPKFSLLAMILMNTRMNLLCVKLLICTHHVQNLLF